MSEFKRVVTNLVMAYGLGSKEQFIDAVSNYAESRDMNDETVKDLIEKVFDELELVNSRRIAKQIFEDVELERKVKEPRPDVSREDFADQFSQPQNAVNSNEKILSELAAIRKGIDSLVEILGKTKNN